MSLRQIMKPLFVSNQSFETYYQTCDSGEVKYLSIAVQRLVFH